MPDFTQPSALRGFGLALRGAIDQNQIAEKLRVHQAVALWPEIAGEQIAAVAAADAVRGKVLFVRAKSSVWASELTFYKPDLLRRLNQKLGGPVLDDIRFSTGNRGGTKRGSAASQAPKTADARDLTGIAPEAPRAAPTADPAAKLAALVARTQAVIAWKRANGWIECGRCKALFEPKPNAKAQGRRSKRNARDAWCPVCRALTAQTG
jgi:hypothetical protein